MKTRLVWLTALLVAGCDLQLGGSVAPLADDAVVLEFESAGGFCSPPGCYTARTFRVDGRFTAVDTPNKVKRSGKIDPALVLAFRSEITKTDFKALRAVDRAKICRGIADSPETTWAFGTGTGKETFKACSRSFEDEALFKAARILLTASGEALKAQPLPTSPFRGVWTVADDPAVKGPIAQDPCAKFRRWVFSPAMDGTEGGQVHVTDANNGLTGYYLDRETLTVGPGADANLFVLRGQHTFPDPTDLAKREPLSNAKSEPVTYKLTYDATRRVATGTRTIGTGKAEPFTLVETTAAAACPAGSPSPSPAPGASPTPTTAAAPTTTPTPGPTQPPSGVPTLAPSSQPSARVLVIGRYGGLCPAGVTCGQETAFQRDGRYVTTSGAKELGAGKVEGTLVDALVAEIAKADFAALKAKPFTGTCPTAFDGQETTYTFMTLAGVEKLPACQYDLPLDHPLFKATQALENARQEQLE